MKKFLSIALISLSAFGFQSCKEYREFENLEVLEDTYDGPFLIADSNADLDMDFSSEGTSGNYCFIWTNPTRGAVCTVNMQGSGILNIEIDDARGNVVSNQILDLSETNEIVFL